MTGHGDVYDLWAREILAAWDKIKGEVGGLPYKLYYTALDEGFHTNPTMEEQKVDVYDPGAIDGRHPQEPAYKAKNTWIRRIQQAHIRVFGNVPALDEWAQPRYVSGGGFVEGVLE